MPTPSEVILKILKDNGVELTEEIESSIKSDLNEHTEVVTADKVLGEGQIAVDEATRRQEKIDISKMRKRMHDAEDRNKELESTLNAGESQLAKENQILKEKLNKMEPQFTNLMDLQRSRWDGLAESVPEDAQKHFHWAQSENEAITSEQVIENLRRYDEYASLGVPGFGQAKESGEEEGTPSFPKASPTAKTGPKMKEDISNINDPDKLLDMAYSKYNKPREEK